MPSWELAQGDCLDFLRRRPPEAPKFDLAFLDPPFNQGRDYRMHDDGMDERDYWQWMLEVCLEVRRGSSEGAAVWFMQREKNSEHVLRILRESGWTFRNLVVWKKKTSPTLQQTSFGKAWQMLAYAVNGERPAVFNHLRIDPPVPAGYAPRERGMLATDVWDDIRELTSGYLAGHEPLRAPDGSRAHLQQAPLALLLRIVLASSRPGGLVLDPFAGTGTTLAVAEAAGRRSLGIEKDPANCEMVKKRLRERRDAERVEALRRDYILTPNLQELWPAALAASGTLAGIAERRIP